MRVFVALLALTACVGIGCPHAAVPLSTQAGQKTTSEIARLVLPAVVLVTVKDSDGAVLATGSGFFVSLQKVVTNLHVIRGGTKVTVTTSLKKVFDVTAYTRDPTHDLAILECPDATDVPILTLDRLEKVEIGENIVAAGSPLGLEGTVSTGIVSALRDRDGVQVIQITAPISPGSSGGPLLNAQGAVIGVNSFTVTNGQNLNFAYPSRHITDLMKSRKPFEPIGGKGGSMPVDAADPNQATLIALLAQPVFSGAEFTRQVLGNVQLELADMDEGRLYFSLESKNVGVGKLKESVQQAAKAFVADTSLLKLATATGNQWKIDDLVVGRSEKRGAVFGSPLSNVRFPGGLVFKFPYKQGIYSVNTPELKGFLESTVVYGGYLNADLRAYAAVMKEQRLINWGAYVTPPGEPSLKRFVGQVTAGLGNEKMPARIQRLVDVVTEQVRNDYTESSEGGEVTKTANSTLMTRRGSRGNKVVLLASLLEQIGTDYLLVYSPGRSWVAVPQRGFPGGSGLAFDWDGTRWILVDATLPRFKIGETKLADPPTVKQLVFVQRPRLENAIIDRVTGKSLSFR